MSLPVLAVLLVTAQEPVETRPDSAAEVSIGGFLDLAIASVDGTLEESRDQINGTSGPAEEDSFVLAAAGLRLDLRWTDRHRASLLIGNLPLDSGARRTLGSNSESTQILVREAYIEARDFPIRSLALRLGAQPLAFSNRYEDDPFFLDLGGSESAWSGTGPTGTRVTADRDTLQPVGARVSYDAAFFLKAQLFAFTLREGGAPSDDESAIGLAVSTKPGDRTTVKLWNTLFSGPDSGASVWTAGLGVVHALDDDWLSAAELYSQFGKSRESLDKNAWAATASLRRSWEETWVEIAYEAASGNDPGDPDDEGWQSYESTRRLLVVQSPEFGLDWDTNYALARAGAEMRWKEGPSIRVDVGLFRLLQDIPALGLRTRHCLGIEADGRLTLRLNENAAVSLALAGLFSSEVLERLTPEAEESAWLATLGTDLRF